ncbi:MAG: cytochrome c3 family protein [Bryobacteraceae bacterium]
MRLFAAAALAVCCFAQNEAPAERPAPQQPLPFSHKQHVSVNGFKCAQCHPMPEPGEFATLPATSVCMGCHTAVKTDSPHIKRLTAAHNAGERIRWAAVYRIPDWVMFSHKIHTAVEGVTCETCHGPVKDRVVMRREKDISMGACMDCHRQNKASNDCRFCHDQR